MVRLLTHNLLACHARNCTSNNFPLELRDVSVALREADYSEDFLRGFIPRLEWPALVQAAKQLGEDSLPEEPLDPATATEEQLKALHHVLLEVHIEEGSMVCPGCQHVYPISNGIPNMLLAEHELARS
ncbi:Trm112p-domain-containing protein [Exidia glandulosa HHB12029]|uniref:Trm112p-domain-containing protein n=1 Tax=Exidia glandulosa HHB12029 TaxID=1314781 RepID=A0A165JQA9_EXIGL|nr:Trm112p-domain-containing protein [Exidia glandulosa HHB12029]